MGALKAIVPGSVVSFAAFWALLGWAGGHYGTGPFPWWVNLLLFLAIACFLAGMGALIVSGTARRR